MGANGYGERGYDGIAFSSVWLGRVLTNNLKRMLFDAVFLLSLAAGSFSERGHSKPVRQRFSSVAAAHICRLKGELVFS